MASQDELETGLNHVTIYESCVTLYFFNSTTLR